MRGDRMSRVVAVNALRADTKHMGPLWSSESAGLQRGSSVRGQAHTGLGTRALTDCMMNGITIMSS